MEECFLASLEQDRHSCLTYSNFTFKSVFSFCWASLSSTRFNMLKMFN